MKFKGMWAIVLRSFHLEITVGTGRPPVAAVAVSTLTASPVKVKSGLIPGD
jgi:hypothetical protein